MPRNEKAKARAKAKGRDIFEKFKELPSELRIQIWGLSAPPPQVITIDYKAPNGWKTSNPIGSCTASYIIPPLLHTNSESRHVGKTIYKKEFADRLGGNGIWIDVDTDILYFCRSAVFVGFFGGRIIDRQFNPRGYKTPLNQHHLPAVAYSTVSDLAGYLHPEALASIGRPKTIYQIRADLSMMEIRRVVWMRVHFHETWDMLRFKTWLEKIEYKKPAVMSLRLEELKSKLSKSKPPLPKIRPFTNQGKTFLRAASFQLIM